VLSNDGALQFCNRGWSDHCPHTIPLLFCSGSWGNRSTTACWQGDRSKEAALHGTQDVGGTRTTYACAGRKAASFCYECTDFPCPKQSRSSQRADILPK
jgi:hypothetical protein